MTTFSNAISAIAAATLLMLSAQGQCATTSYAFFDLGQGYASAINDSGQIAGNLYAYDSAHGFSGGATIWNQGQASVLPQLNWYQGTASGINQSGQVVGSIRTPPYSDERAALYSDGGVRALNTLGGISSTGVGINDRGQVVGMAMTGDYVDHAALWEANQVKDLGSLSGANGRSVASDINNIGQIVGASQTSNTTHATLWASGSMTDLGAFGPDSSGATAINDAGDVVGWGGYYNADTADVWRYAVRWGQNGPVKLGALSGHNSEALGINELGTAVGYAETSDGHLHAVLWNGTEVIDLNSFLTPELIAEGWELTHAVGINSQGDVVGQAHNSRLPLSFSEHGFLLSATAVPEPSMWALFSIGLVGLSLRRPKPHCQSRPF